MNYEILHDETAENPRKAYDHLGTILYVSSRYLLGDEKVDTDEIERVQNDESLISLPVFAYIHGNVALSTEPFGDRWDSGQSGVIYVSKEAVMKEWSCSVISDELLSTIESCLKAEIGEFSAYLSGEVYGWVLKDGGEEIDSCWGYTSYEDAETDARHAMETALFDKAKKSEHTVIYGG
jgi:hypothetical protein